MAWRGTGGAWHGVAWHRWRMAWRGTQVMHDMAWHRWRMAWRGVAQVAHGMAWHASCLEHKQQLVCMRCDVACAAWRMVHVRQVVCMGRVLKFVCKALVHK
eukprot:356742-Chlamydomonas_euryale.AAC.7